MVKLSVVNILGEKVAVLANEEFTSGTHKVNFNASRLASGVYFYTIEAGDFRQTRKMILMK